MPTFVGMTGHPGSVFGRSSMVRSGIMAPDHEQKALRTC